MRRIAPLLLVFAACSLEHPISRIDGAVRTDGASSDVAVDVPEPVDAIDASAPDLVEPVDAPDAVDVAEPVDAVDVPEPVDAIDVAEPVDRQDAGAPPDAPDVIEPVDRPDVVDVPAPQDVLDVVSLDTPDVIEPVDRVDVPALPDIVDAPALPDIVDAPAPRDVPVVPDAPTYAYTLVTTDLQSTVRQGNTNGTDRVLLCNAGEVLVGLSIRASAYVSGFASRCAALRTNGTLGAVRETTYFGGTVWGTRVTDDCPAGSMVVGLTGRAGGIVDRVAVQCASLASWIPARALTATLPTRGGDGGSDFSMQCPVGFVGLGVEFDTTFYAADFRAARLRLTCVRVSRQPP